MNMLTLNFHAQEELLLMCAVRQCGLRGFSSSMVLLINNRFYRNIYFLSSLLAVVLARLSSLPKNT